MSLFICDNGIGISKQDIHRVFDKGFTGESGRNYAKATGLGLYLCRKLCLKLGLNISLKSEQEKGSTVEEKGREIICVFYKLRLSKNITAIKII